MNKVTIVSLATVSAALVVGVTALEAVTVATTHSANPFNMKTNSDFKNMVESKKISDVKNFENVKAFVDAKGRGTLIAKKTDKSGELEFKYYKHGETINLSKGDIVFRDWGAVREYIRRFDKPEIERVINPEVSVNSVDAAGSVKVHSGKQGGKSDETAMTNVSLGSAGKVATEDIKSQKTLKEVLSELGITEEEFDKILDIFSKVKCQFIFSSACNVSDTSFVSFYPENRISSFLQAPTVKRMKDLFYGEKDWGDWKSVLEPTLGPKNTPNPVVGCYYWVSNLQGAEKVGKMFNEEPETIKKRIREFVVVFYSLVGIKDKVDAAFEAAREAYAANNRLKGNHEPRQSDFF